MHGAPWKARHSESLSKAALQEWAGESGFKVAYFDSKKRNPRTGIADAILVRVRPKSPDQVEVYLVELKGGSSGLKAAEMARLQRAAAAVKAQPRIILHDGERLFFLGGEASFTSTAQRRS